MDRQSLIDSYLTHCCNQSSSRLPDGRGQTLEHKGVVLFHIGNLIRDLLAPRPLASHSLPTRAPERHKQGLERFAVGPGLACTDRQGSCLGYPKPLPPETVAKKGMFVFPLTGLVNRTEQLLIPLYCSYHCVIRNWYSQLPSPTTRSTAQMHVVKPISEPSNITVGLGVKAILL